VEDERTSGGRTGDRPGKRAPARRAPRARSLLVAAALLLPLLPGGSSGAAADDCKPVPSTLAQVQQAVLAGSTLYERLERTGAEVAVVARIGTDQRKRGILYTHAGLAWRDHPKGRWHFIHELNHCGRDSSELFDDGPVDFFLERPFRYDAWVVVPAPELRRSIVALLREGADRLLHEPSYNAIAHPFRTRFQNSNQWLLELIAVALEPAGPRTRAYAQEVLRRRSFEPARVRLGFFERIGTHNRDNVSLSDHDRSELREGGYLYVSVESLVAFLRQQDLIEQAFEIAPEAPP
jgi:hypothetical protein